MIYFYIYFYCILGTVFSFSNKYQKYRKYYLGTITLLLVLLAGLRYNIGFDYQAYVEIFNNNGTTIDVLTGNINLDIEKGYLLLNALVKDIGLGVEVIFFIMALITIILLFISFYKYSNYLELSILIYLSRFFFVRDMGQIRSSLACAIVLYSIKFIKEKDIKKFGICILIGCLFHKGAILGVLLYVLCKFKPKNYNIYYIILALSLIIGSIDITSLIQSISWIIPERYLDYIFNSYYISGKGILNPVLLIQITIILMFIKYRNKIKPNQKYYDILLNGYLISTVILSIFSRFDTIAGRLSTILATFEVVIIPSFIFIFSDKNAKKFASILIILYSLAIFYVLFVSRNIEFYIPYTSIFNK